MRVCGLLHATASATPVIEARFERFRAARLRDGDMDSLVSQIQIPSEGTARRRGKRRPAPWTVLVPGLGGSLGLAILLLDWRVVLLALAALGLGLVTFRFPLVGALAYIFIATTHPEELGISPVFFRVQLIFALVCIAALAMPALRRRHLQPWKWLGTDKAVVALFLAACASVPLAVSRLVSAGACWQFAKVLFSYWLIRRTATSFRSLRAVAWVAVGGSSVVALLALWGWYTGNVFIGERGVARLHGLAPSYETPNDFANPIIASLTLMIVLAAIERGWVAKALLIMMAGCCLIAVALTGARAGVVSLGVVVLLVILTGRRRAFAAISLSAVLLLVWVKLPPDLVERYRSIATYQNELTYQMRVENVESGLQMLIDHPLTGVGLSCFAIARVEQYNRTWVSPHNVYAKVSSEMGAIGLAAFAVFTFALFGTSISARRLLPRAELDPWQRRWLQQLCAAVMIMSSALLVQGLAGQNLESLNYYLGAALATNSLEIAAKGLKQDASARTAEGNRGA